MELLGRAKDPSGQFSYTPIEDRGDDLILGYFRPGEVYENSEKTYAGYVRVDFGTDLGGDMRISGNIGARYIHTQDDSVGAISFPARSQVIGTFADFASYCAAQQDQVNQPPPPGPVNNAPPQPQLPALCRPGVTDAQRDAVLAFADGTQLPQTATQEFDNFLPSLNVRLDVTDKLLFRFAASRAISRPNFGDLRNFLSIGFNGTTGAFEARASNPFLRPIRSDQFDLTAEWYFAPVGSLTVAGFYKNLKDVILGNSGFSRDISNNGSGYTLNLTGPANSPGNTSVKGLELGYQQTYDFLPGALAGLGAQATYTYIDAGQVEISPPDYRPSADPTPLEGDGNQPPLDVQGLYDNLELPGLSKHNFNASIFYDRAGLYLRAAYSWRSKYLLTNRDCCFPFLPVYAASYGQLDGSAFYTVNEQFKLGIEVQNILDATTKTVFRLNGDGLESPRQFSKADRTYTISARMNF
jgi:TonB-dependent receptor